jgi:hypothetical protein
MKGQNKIKRGSGFKGVISYSLDHDDAEILGGTVSSKSVDAITREFVTVSSLRSDIDKPVWHNSLRLPKGEKLSNQQWLNIASDYMNEMKLDQNQWIAIKHDDPKGEHIHIVANRINADQSVYLGKNENLKSTRVISALEIKHGLTITKSADFDNQTKRRGKAIMSKNEIEQAIRTGEAPNKQQLQFLIDAAKEDRPGIFEFMDRLDEVSVTALPNVSKTTGRMNGFSFEMKGVAFKASQLGKMYGWKQLSNEVKYEQVRDSEELIGRADKIKSRQDKDNSGVERADRKHGAVNDHDEPAIRKIDQGNGSESEDGRSSDDSVGQKNVEAGSNDRSSGERVRSDRDQANDSISNDRINDIRYSVSAISDLAADELALDHKKKIEAWREQSKAFDPNTTFRLTLVPRPSSNNRIKQGAKPWNVGKNADGSEDFFTAAMVEKKIKMLRQRNAMGYDVYITPISEKYHYIVLDDTNEKSLDKLEQTGGHKPALVQMSSKDNYQAVFKVKKDNTEKHEQQLANSIVRSINQKFGDKKFSGVVHPFRMSGFSNQKEGKDRFYTKVIKSVNRVCTVLSDMLQSKREHHAEHEIKVVTEQRVKRALSVDSQSDSAMARMYKATFESEYNNAKAKGWDIDYSVIDYRCAKALAKDGYSDEAIARTLLVLSPAINDRHKNPDAYVMTTASKASADPDVQIERKEAQEREYKRSRDQGMSR